VRSPGRRAPRQGKGAAEEGLRLSKEAGIEGGHAPFFVRGSAATFFLNLLANVAVNEGDYERAKTLGEGSLALGRQANEAQGIVWSLLMLAIAASLRADCEDKKSGPAVMMRSPAALLAKEAVGEISARLCSPFHFLRSKPLEQISRTTLR
jgi:hypothetical protein